MERAELLSPAGSAEGLKAAVCNGADAVYLGLADFNARKKAANFDGKELEKWVEFAHLYGVKVYVTLNTLVKNSEIAGFLNAVERAVDAGADALIVQSLGNARLIKKAFPNAILHASTQMGICNRYGARLCLDEGISRIILPRECSIKDIEDIKGSVDIELEVFIHGALCMSFSGNCFMSSFLSCNSGNRGMCLQPCRMFYHAYRDDKPLKDGYLLSLSDLKVGQEINKLIEAGVTGFKIEGRMRRPEYAAIATAYYRNILDGKAPTAEEEYALEAAYNRGGFTEGYYFGAKDLSSTVHQGHKGFFVGKAKNIDKEIIEVESLRELEEGDGFKLFDDEGKETGSAVFYKKVFDNIYALKYKGKVKAGANVHITTDKSINDFYLNKKKFLQVNISFSARVGQHCVLDVKYQDINISVKSDYIAEKGNKNIIDREFINKKLKKIDDIYDAEKIEIYIDDETFIPLSVLTSLKNDAARLLKERILGRYNKPVIKQDITHLIPDLHSTMQKAGSTMQSIMKAVISDDAEILSAISDAHALIFKPFEYSEADFDELFNMVKEQVRDKLYLYIPYFVNSEDLEIIEGLFSKYKFKGIYAENASGILLARKYGLDLFGGVGLNIFNDYDILFIEDYCENYALSQELSQKEIEELAYSRNAFVFSYGEIELMNMSSFLMQATGSSCKNCGYAKGIYLKDLKGEIFFLRRRKISKCYFSIINGRKLCALKNITGKMLFNFVGEDLHSALAAYNLAKPDGGFTGGHFHRAVK